MVANEAKNSHFVSELEDVILRVHIWREKKTRSAYKNAKMTSSRSHTFRAYPKGIKWDLQDAVSVAKPTVINAAMHFTDSRQVRIWKAWWNPTLSHENCCSREPRATRDLRLPVAVCNLEVVVRFIRTAANAGNIFLGNDNTHSRTHWFKTIF